MTHREINIIFSQTTSNLAINQKVRNLVPVNSMEQSLLENKFGLGKTAFIYSKIEQLIQHFFISVLGTFIMKLQIFSRILFTLLRFKELINKLEYMLLIDRLDYNIAGRLSEKSRDSFVELQSQNDRITEDQKKSFHSIQMFYFDKESLLL